MKLPFVVEVLLALVCLVLLATVGGLLIAIGEAQHARYQLPADHWFLSSPSESIGTILKQADPPPDEQCAVCRDEFTQPIRLPCLHYFCEVCIRTTLSQRDNCPLCNTRFFNKLDDSSHKARIDRCRSLANGGIVVAFVSLAVAYVPKPAVAAVAAFDRRAPALAFYFAGFACSAAKLY